MRIRRQLDAPVFVNTKTALGSDLNQSPTDGEWIKGPDDLFGIMGKYNWIPVGAFSVAQDTSTGEFYLVVKANASGVRKKTHFNG